MSKYVTITLTEKQAKSLNLAMDAAKTHYLDLWHKAIANNGRNHAEFANQGIFAVQDLVEVLESNMKIVEEKMAAKAKKNSKTSDKCGDLAFK